MDDYDKITMVDTRYYRGNIEELAADYDSVLLLYGIDNFAGEKLNFRAQASDNGGRTAAGWKPRLCSTQLPERKIAFTRRLPL